MKQSKIIFLIIVLFLLTSCGLGSKPLSYKVRWDLGEPAEEVPSQDITSKPTQRPYRINGKTYYPIPSSHGFSQEGTASWYGKKFHGRKTSNGETYNMHAMTAAHKTLPMGTQVLVKNIDNGKEITVRINDRGPFVKGRVIDLSYEAAKKLGFDMVGTASVKLLALGETEVVVAGGVKSERFLPHQDFSKGNFFVQVGAFSNKSNAERLFDKLNTWGRKAYIREASLDGKVMYRVQVAAGNTLDEAMRTERVFENSGFEQAFVVAQ